MHHIKPLHKLTAAEVADLAHAAADRGEDAFDANPYRPGTAQRAQFDRAHAEREAALLDLRAPAAVATA